MENKFGKIVVLYGGPSPEAEVSKVSAAAVCAALENLAFPYEKLELAGGWITTLQQMRPGFVFLALHGCPGEDGTVQGVLDLMNLPYNGSGVLASALAMDKPRAKKIFAASGLDVAKEHVLYVGAPENRRQVAALLPCVLKPARGGSSVGTAIARSEADIPAALNTAFEQGQCCEVLAEEYIPGKEYTVAVVAGKALTVTEITPAATHTFYDYQAKYAAGGSVHVCPADIPETLMVKLKRQAEVAHAALGCSGITRSDFRYTPETGRIVILETNTLPGLTPTSLVPEQARFMGISFEQLVVQMIEDGVCHAQTTAA